MTGRRETERKETGRRETGRKETGRKEMRGKTNGSKERGVGETVAKEGEETIVKAMGVRETGGKVSYPLHTIYIYIYIYIYKHYFQNLRNALIHYPRISTSVSDRSNKITDVQNT